MSGGETALSCRSLLAAAIAAAAAMSACEGTHLRLVNEGDPGPLYRCGASTCDPAQRDDPSRKNLSGMDFHVLPDGCVELRSALLRRSGPGVEIACGPEGSERSYLCEAGGCHPNDPSDGADTRPIALPADCGGRIHELIVLDARTSAPSVYVECDASSGPLGEM
jgi:hypothetical protein